MNRLIFLISHAVTMNNFHEYSVKTAAPTSERFAWLNTLAVSFASRVAYTRWALRLRAHGNKINLFFGPRRRTLEVRTDVTS